MSNNWKEQSVYNYIHRGDNVPRRLFGVILGWKRHNGNRGKARYEKRLLTEKQIDNEKKEIINECTNM
ncbi:MAG: hypothetical protein RR383_10150 [Muribaculaceae bacterium]